MDEFVAASFVYVVKEQFNPAVTMVALQGSSLIGGAGGVVTQVVKVSGEGVVDPLS
jgi:hypothetical protein